MNNPFKRKKKKYYSPIGFWDIRAHWTFVTVFILSLLSVVVLFLYVELLTPESNFNITRLVAEESNKQNPEPILNDSGDAEFIRIVATGDMIPHDALNLRAKNGDSYDYYQFMDNMQKFFDASDINFCNQAVLGAGEEFGIKGYPAFNSPVEFAQDMHKVGCNLINTGSNHTNDFDQEMIDASVAAWDDLDTYGVAGANRSNEEKNSIDYFEVNGVKFAFLSYTTYTNTTGETDYGLTMYSDSFARKQITAAKENADAIIVSMRWGVEYSSGVTRQQRQWARDLTQMGANIILGHGPHVLAPAEKIESENGNKSVVWYSLGNFLNAQLEAETLFNGFAVMDLDAETLEIINVAYLPVYMHYEWSSADAAAENLLARDNFEMYVIDEAAEPLSKSQLNTEVFRQVDRISSVLNTYDEIVIWNSEDYLTR